MNKNKHLSITKVKRRKKTKAEHKNKNVSCFFLYDDKYIFKKFTYNKRHSIECLLCYIMSYD